MSKLIDAVLNSSLLKKDLPYRVILPEKYEEEKKRFPVLYLLHGLFGSFENWTELTSLQTYADGCHLIIVTPEGGDNWYTDSGEKYESYLIHELIPAIDARFRTIADRSGRAIAGNSMGGYGAFKFALKYPELFSFAASFSGAFHVSELSGSSAEGNWEELGLSISKIFGDKESTIRKVNAMHSLVVKKDLLPYFYFDCGTDDVFISANRELEKLFDENEIPHEFHEIEGGHDWPYWDSRIEHLLDITLRKIKFCSYR